MTNATTNADATDVLKNVDVVDIICGPMQAKIRNLERQIQVGKAAHAKTQRYVSSVHVYIIFVIFVCVCVS